MIGKVYTTYVDFFDSATNTTKRKTRPVLVVGGPRNNDYVILPISTISRRQNLDTDYDIEIKESERKVLNLSKECFIRTHKQMFIHQGAFLKEKGDMKADLPELYLTALAKMEKYQQLLIDQSL